VRPTIATAREQNTVLALASVPPWKNCGRHAGVASDASLRMQEQNKQPCLLAGRRTDLIHRPYEPHSATVGAW